MSDDNSQTKTSDIWDSSSFMKGLLEKLSSEALKEEKPTNSLTCAHCGKSIDRLPFTPGPGQKVYHRECMIYDRAEATELGEKDFYNLENKRATINAGRVHKSAKDAYYDGYHGARRAYEQAVREEEYKTRQKARYYRPPMDRSSDTVGRGGRGSSSWIKQQMRGPRRIL